MLRAWLAGAGKRPVAAQAGVDRKTARRYVAAARGGGPGPRRGRAQLSDELLGQVAEAVRPVRPAGHGRPGRQLEACRAEITGVGEAGPDAGEDRGAAGTAGRAVPYRTLAPVRAERCGYGRSAATTVRVADGEPGMECQLDFGYLGMITDPVTGRRRKVHALVVHRGAIPGTVRVSDVLADDWPR